MEKEKETEKKKKKQGEKEVFQFYIYKLPIDRPAAVSGITSLIFVIMIYFKCNNALRWRISGRERWDVFLPDARSPAGHLRAIPGVVITNIII